MKLARSSSPFSTAFAIAAPPLVPNSSYAAASFSDSVPLPCMVSAKPCNASSSVIPSSVAFFMAVFRPIIAVDESRPAIDIEPSKDAASSADSPISWNCAALAATISDN